MKVSSILTVTFTCISVCRRSGSVMAALVRHLGTALLLLSLLLCQWGCTYRGYVHGLPISGERIGHPSPLCGNGSLVPLQPNGRPHPLWYWLRTHLLWGQLCPPHSVVGIWVPHVRGEYNYLARSWRLLVEDHRLVVSSSFL